MYDKAYLSLQQLGAIKSKLFSKTSYLIGSGWPHAPGEWRADDVADDDVDYVGHWAQLIYCIVTLCY